MCDWCECGWAFNELAGQRRAWARACGLGVERCSWLYVAAACSITGLQLKLGYASWSVACGLASWSLLQVCVCGQLIAVPSVDKCWAQW